ncbi:hypothetical protein NHX12_033045 [Muraenolepis orangiensis]|uniref:LEM domain-containing protein n=1 Tax=Muraenolepis orangiensis TaxID=630683 RepID=A0A9Q0IFZ3_9TELE|nr:hypothetical protein NHX12_033045 [Muraenolepis orangiensis]
MDLKKKTLAGRLCRAVQDEESRSVQVLLSQGASANLVGAQGVAAVHLAAGKESEKSVRCLKLLLRHGADPNVRSSEGLTPLHVAALWGCNQNLKLLLANGGDPNVTDQEGNTPGQFAEQQDNRKCAQLLQNHRVQSADLVEDLPRFQNSSDSDQTDIYSYPDSDSSLSSRLSIIGDFAEDPLSSTRHSALFDWPSSSYPHPCSRGGPSSRRMDADPGGGRPSFLSSTRMSTAGGGSAMPVVQEDVVSFRDEDTWAGNAWEGPSLLSSTRMSTAGPVLRDRPVADHYVEAPAQRVNSHPLGLECRFLIPLRDTPTADMAGPSGQARQRSVRFHVAAEYLPVTSSDEYLPVTSSDEYLNYSSCDSGHYTTANYTTAYGGLLTSRSSSSEEEAELGALESEADFQVDALENIAAQVGKLTLSDQADDKNPQRESEDEGDVVGAEQPGMEGSDTNAESGSSSSSSYTSLRSSMSTSGSDHTGDETVVYDWQSLGAHGITDKELRHRLLELGESPGPITTHTRPVYIKRLCRLILESNTPSPQPQHTHLDQSHTNSGYSQELSRALMTFELPECHASDLELCQQFDQPDLNMKWREGVIKSSLNYLLLDPRVTKNLPYCSRTMSPHECFQTFVRAIFYVGKGKHSRPHSHLYEALEYFKGVKTSKKLCSKVQHILQVWSGGQGVISLHCFQNIIPVEAFTREACIVDAIGLKMLTNQKRGNYYGVVSTWQASKQRELGVHLLYRAMLIFLAEGERQLRPADIRQ